MKKCLSVLLCVVFLHAQIPVAHAKSGGPDIGGFGSVSVQGTYAGVLIPTSGTEADADGGFNSIGLFTMQAPQTGYATGAFQFFGAGEVYNGTITGIADPDKKTINALLEASALTIVGSTTLTDGTDSLSLTESTVSAKAVGSLKADVRANSLPVVLGAGSSARITGDAQLNVFPVNDSDVQPASFVFAVDGFKQSETATTIVGQ